MTMKLKQKIGWLVEIFLPPSHIEPLVNKGKYSPVTHGQLFTGLRNLLILRYWKNVTLSLLKYMREEHYPSKSYTYTNVWQGKHFSVQVAKQSCIFAKALVQSSIAIDK